MLGKKIFEYLSTLRSSIQTNTDRHYQPSSNSRTLTCWPGDRAHIQRHVLGSFHVAIIEIRRSISNSQACIPDTPDSGIPNRCPTHLPSRVNPRARHLWATADLAFGSVEFEILRIGGQLKHDLGNCIGYAGQADKVDFAKIAICSTHQPDCRCSCSSNTASLHPCGAR